MMDFFLKYQKSPLQIKDFLAEIFECFASKIKVFSLDDFNCLAESLDCFSLSCVCVFSSVQGDASQLLQLYRYNISDTDVVERVIDIALKNNIHIYIPNDSLNDWIYVGDNEIKHAHQIESDGDNCFCFEFDAV